MTKPSLSERLRELARDDKSRSKAARFRDVFEDIERALAAGVSQSKVVEVLQEGGLTMTLASFRNAIQRTRKARGGKVTTHNAQTRPVETASSKQTSNRLPEPDLEPEQEPETVQSTSSNPKDLDSVIGATPDLVGLAKAAKGKRK